MKTQRQPASRAFTLVELLVVITIIAILASLTASGIINAIDQANRLKVRAVVMELKNGIDLYQTEYTRYPIGASLAATNGEDTPELLTDGSNSLVDTLMGIPPASNGTTDPNPKRIPFAQFPPANNGRHGLVGAARPFKLTDLYGQPYHILLDTNGDNQVKNPDTSNTDSKISQNQAAYLVSKVAVYSSGKDQAPRTGDDVATWRPK
jgi:prepilin-type N-terminal cleavage/methylation domain-containing protein